MVSTSIIWSRKNIFLCVHTAFTKKKKKNYFFQKILFVHRKASLKALLRSEIVNIFTCMEIFCRYTLNS